MTNIRGWCTRSSVLAMLLGLGAVADASAQTLGTYSIQLQPFCNVLTLTVTVDGPFVAHLTGFDDQCGAPVRTPVSGSATLNADGTIGVSLFSVTADGRASHITSLAAPVTHSGPWQDNGNQSGFFAYGVPSPQPGIPRPVPLLPGSAIAPGAVGAQQANLAELQRRVTGTCSASQAVQVINEDGSVSCAPSGSGDITSVAVGAGLTGGGASGTVSVAVAPAGISSALLADDSVTDAKLALPWSRSVTSASPALAIGNAGTGRAANFSITNGGSVEAVAGLTHAGTGHGLTVALTSASNGGRGVNVIQQGVGPGVFADSQGGHGVWGITHSISAAGVIGDNQLGEAVVGRSQSGVGIGAVVGRNDGLGYGVRGFNTNGGIGVFGQAGISGGTGVAGRFENLNAVNTSTALVVSTNSAGDLIETLAAGQPVFRVTSAGNVQADGAFTSPAADLAEFIDTMDAVGPADVVEIDPDRDGHFRLAREASSAAVAGVLTTKPGVLLNSRDDRNDLSQGAALALAGRIPVKVSAENGAIRPGDLLVASSTPGHAMRAPANPAPGTVIGKALGSHDAAMGVIEMLVMLR